MYDASVLALNGFVALAAPAIAMTFLFGASTKMRNIESFRLACSAYPGAAHFGVVKVSTGMIVGELASGAMILAPEQTCSSIGLVAGVLLTLAVTAVVAERWRRGERRFRCGCGTDLAAESSATMLLARNSLFLLILTAAAVTNTKAPGCFADWAARYLAAAGIVISAYLLAAARLTWIRIVQWQMDT